MNLWFNKFSELDFDALMEVYEEGNRRLGEKLFPYESEENQLQRTQRRFEEYLSECFFQQDGAAYCVLADNGMYICAGRIERFADGYLLSALETRPDCRQKGYGKAFLTALIQQCNETGKLPVYSHIFERNVPSMKLHLQCGFSIYKDSAKLLDGSVRSDFKTLIYNE